MAPGVRIQHPTERDCAFTLVTSRPYAAPFDCPVCRVPHEFKTYHFRLDGSGATIVSQEIWERLRQAGPLNPFQAANEVARPPSQRIIVHAPIAQNARVLRPGGGIA